PVTVNAPEPVSGTFDATIDIADIINFDSGQFDLSFDASVVNVTGVDSGSIDGTEVPIDMWRFIDPDTIRVIFNLPDTTGVSGSGSLTTISFEVLGVTDDTSILAISDGLLVDTESNEISSLWFDDGITVGAPVTVNAPEVVSGTFDATIDIADITNLDSGQFDMSFDASVVNVTGVNSGSIDGTEVPIDMWRFLDPDTIRVIFNLPDTNGVSGSGSLTTISFEALGVAKDTSVLAISDGLLVDNESNEILSLWFDDVITVGIPVTVNAPEVVSGTFDATIDIADVTNLDSGQFDLSFDATVVNVTGVDSGSIDGTEVPIDMWRFLDTDTIRVIFNLPNTTGVSGSGSLATISFEVLSVTDDTSVLAISDGLLVDIESNEISSLWSDDEITLDVPVDVPVTVNAPEVVTDTFDATIDIADVTNLDSGEFDLSFDASVVNVTGVNSGSINGTYVPIDEWDFIDPDTIRVLFNLPGTTGVSGSGSLTIISFEVLGVTDDTSVLAISDGLLVDTESNEISSLWSDDEITLDVPVDVPVTVNAPEVVSGTFDATIDIADVTNLDSGEFDLSFDASVVNVTGVNSGSINGTYVPIDEWDFIDPDTIRVLFNLPGTTGVSGSGSLTIISFEVLGVTDDTSVLAISDGLLVDTESNEISSLWSDDEITLDVPVDVPVTVNAPEVVSGTFDATIDIADVTNLDSGEFNLSFDATVVNVTGVNSGSIGGTDVPIDEWDFIDPDTIRVLFNLSGTTGVSGSGSLATISFEVLGVTDDTSILAISDGLLVDIESNEISSLWSDDEITLDV
ncbi:MAG: cohesin domain-containing protein, partial [Methanosarcinales archaeon]|nr:cohesin domain-containing protein [Methanosarcinales archaeon]